MNELPTLESLTKERDDALNALTVSQEEWLLRTKALEAQNYKLKEEISHYQQIEQTLFSMWIEARKLVDKKGETDVLSE